MLFFLAGNEIDFERIRGRALNRSIFGWLISLVAGVAIGLLIAPTPAAGVFIGVALDQHRSRHPDAGAAGRRGDCARRSAPPIIAIGAVGEFGPLIAISLFLSGTNPGVGDGGAGRLRADHRAVRSTWPAAAPITGCTR